LGKYDRGGRASALFLPPHHRAFGSLSALTKKNANARGLSGGGRGGEQRELTDLLFLGGGGGYFQELGPKINVTFE